MKDSVRIAYGKTQFEVGLGDGPIQPTDGYGGYAVLDRSRDDGITQWAGQAPPAFSLPLLLDGYAENKGVQRDLDRVLKLGRSEDGDEAPPVFRVSGPFQGSGKRYVMEGTPEFGQTIRDSKDGRLLRQFLTLTIRRYVAPDQVKIKRRRQSSGVPWTSDARTYTTKQGDTLVSIAAKLRPQDSGKERIRYAKEMGDKNSIRDIRKRLSAGTVLRLP